MVIILHQTPYWSLRQDVSDLEGEWRGSRAALSLEALVNRSGDSSKGIRSMRGKRVTRAVGVSVAVAAGGQTRCDGREADSRDLPFRRPVLRLCCHPRRREPVDAPTDETHVGNHAAAGSGLEESADPDPPRPDRMLANREDPARRMSTSNAQFGPVKLIENVGWVVGDISRLTYGNSAQLQQLNRIYWRARRFELPTTWFVEPRNSLHYVVPSSPTGSPPSSNRARRRDERRLQSRIHCFGQTCEHLRSHAQPLNASEAVTPYEPGRELSTTTRLRAGARAGYPTRHPPAYGVDGNRRSSGGTAPATARPSDCGFPLAEVDECPRSYRRLDPAQSLHGIRITIVSRAHAQSIIAS